MESFSTNSFQKFSPGRGQNILISYRKIVPKNSVPKNSATILIRHRHKLISKFSPGRGQNIPISHRKIVQNNSVPNSQRYSKRPSCQQLYNIKPTNSHKNKGQNRQTTGSKVQ